MTLSTAFLALGLVTGTFASPLSARQTEDGASLDIPDDLFVVPGPGLPSLESMGVTPADLVEIARNYDYSSIPLDYESENKATVAVRALEARAAVCNTSGLDVYIPSTQACLGFLLNLDRQACVAPTNGIVMCYSGSGSQRSTITGRAIGGSSTSSWFRHVAYAVEQVWSTCRSSTQWHRKGYEFAYGNGNLRVNVD